MINLEQDIIWQGFLSQSQITTDVITKQVNNTKLSTLFIYEIRHQIELHMCSTV